MKLGFGLMRLPKKDGEVNHDELCKMVDLFLERGYTYFDTAFVYKGSEEATKKALIDRHDRSSFTLASKLHAAVVSSQEEAEQEFYTSLERCGTDYFDYYLLHALTEGNHELYDKFDLWNFVQARKAEGKIRHIGFSFHGGPELLEKLLTEHPEVEFVQLQINYADWENPKVQSRCNYEVVRRFGKQLVIMEPVKGGNLMRLPKAVRDILGEGHRPAEWALKFAASMDGLLAVLSGMSDLAQMEENTALLKDFDKLSEADFATAVEAGICFSSAREIPCTACGYCLEGCPQQIQIPKLFSAYNDLLFTGERTDAYEKTEGPHAAECLACRKCEEVCPQHIKISEKMPILVETFGA